MKIRTICQALAFGMALTMASLNATAGIVYQVVDLADPDGAPDTRRIDYRIDTATPSLYGYSLYFDAALFGDLQPLSVEPDWFASVIQPDPGFSLAGVVDLLSLTELPPNAGFSVQFTWLGNGATGSQAYTMFDDAFNVIGSGQTRLSPQGPDLPEPASTALMLAGLAAMAGQRQRARQQRR